MNENEPQSPCVSICVLDEKDICQGCFRSAEEVTDWFMSSNERKREILALAQERREEASPFRLL
ncbi:MAG: DUF1289 domain-containing protein [Pseudomonadales bacterium]|jgi:predicted Fe-S protein YdhL (DUF1289 family)|nr:DUF1289 domain-containing protein [Pseudomonadales bacterium]